ncbi:DUF167 domain-containing protein [Thermodesulfobacteriota bacterium]
MGTGHGDREPGIDAYIKIKLLPGSSKNQIVGKEGDVYKVKVTSPPVDGKANRALISLLAKQLGIPKGSIEIKAGKSSRIKLVRVNRLSKVDIYRLLDGK